MLIAVLIATLCSLLTASVVLLVQGFGARRQERLVARQRSVAELAQSRDDRLTPVSVAEALGMNVFEADKVLRSMVDDVHFTMGIDETAGQLEFWFIDHEPPQDAEVQP